MALSLKSISASKVGISPPFYVVKDFFDYRFGILADAAAGEPHVQLSLRKQLELVNNRTSFGIDIGLVGELQNSAVAKLKIARAVQYARDIFARAWFAIDRVGWHGVPSDYKPSEIAEEEDLGKKRNVDVFVVPYDLGDKSGVYYTYEVPIFGWTISRQDGVVVLYLPDNIKWMGQTIAHELGHFFGLNHRKSLSNLMWSPKCGRTGPPTDSELTGWQGGHIVDNIKRFNKSGNPDDIEEEEAECL